MIVFSITGGLSVGAAFLSTIVPGLILSVWYCVLNFFFLRNNTSIVVQKKTTFKASMGEIAKSGYDASFALMMPILILGVIYSGIATPTEAAAISVVYAIIVSIFIYKGMTFKQLGQVTLKAAVLTGSIMAVLFFLFVMSRVMIMQKIPNELADAMLALSDNKYIILFLINILLLLIGMIVDDISGSILAAVIFLPVIQALGIHPIHFAAIVGVNLGLGNVSPPCAPMLYMAGGISKLGLEQYFKPTLMLLLFGHLPIVFIVTFFPPLSLYLPKLIMGVM